jgi:hypothetical protein
MDHGELELAFGKLINDAVDPSFSVNLDVCIVQYLPVVVLALVPRATGSKRGSPFLFHLHRELWDALKNSLDLKYKPLVCSWLNAL